MKEFKLNVTKKPDTSGLFQDGWFEFMEMCRKADVYKAVFDTVFNSMAMNGKEEAIFNSELGQVKFKLRKKSD